MYTKIFVKQSAQLLGHKAALYALTSGFEDDSILTGGGEGWVTQWNMNEPALGHLVATVETSIFALFTLPHLQRLVVGDRLGGVHWIDWSSKKKIYNVLHHKGGVFAIWHNQQQPHSPVITLGGDGRLTAWDAQQCRPLESIKLSQRPLRCMAAAPNHQYLAVGASDGLIYFIDNQLSIIRIIENAHAPSVFSLAFSPLGDYLLSGGRDALLKVWSLAADAPICQKTLPAHYFTINRIAFSPSGKLFATASRDKTLKIWQTEGVELLKVLDVKKNLLDAAPEGHFNSVNNLLWTSETQLVSVSDDRTGIVWTVQP